MPSIKNTFFNLVYKAFCFVIDFYSRNFLYWMGKMAIFIPYFRIDMKIIYFTWVFTSKVLRT